MMPYRHFELTIKEKGGAVLHPSYMGCVDEEFLVDFFGLNNPDVESYEITEIKHKTMSRKQQLQECLEDYRKTPVRIILEWEDGTKAGIGNALAINAAMTALREELKRQIEELE